MDQSEEIRGLKEQLEQLSKQVVQQQNQLNELQQRLPAYNYNLQRSNLTKQKAATTFDLENFIGLRLIHLVGIVVLVIGLAIGVKYAIDQNLISPFTRIALAYAAGGILYTLSLYLKNKYEAFSAILFSGGMASFYFTTYAGSAYYDLFPAWLAFVVMIGLTVYTAITSLRYNRQEIAVLGMVGAYGIPFLISKNKDASLLFFCYILLINTGIVLLAFKHLWRTLKLLSFFITWIIFIGWTFIRYQPREQAIGVAFMILFYLVFIASALISYYRENKNLSKTDRSILILNNLAVYITSLVLFKVQFNEETGADITALFCLLCFLLSYVAGIIFSTEKNISKYFSLQGIAASVLYVALEFRGISITLIWLGIALVLFVAGIYSNRAWPRLCSIATFGITLLKLLFIDSVKFSTIQKIISYLIIGSLLLIVSFFYQKFKLAFFGKEKEED